MQSNQKVFAFIVVMYNHESYIIQHLESIKYLIQSHGDGISFDIIVNDDCSKDFTIKLVDKWFDKNDFLFRNVIKIYNQENVGTCKSIVNIISAMKSDVDVCKMTAGDDIYSFENLFESAFKYSDEPIVSGIPLHFSDSTLYLDRREFLGIVSSFFCYQKSKLSKRFKFLSVNNAPNIFYNKKILTSRKLLSFLSTFDVVEDWPIQVAISEIAEKPNYILVDRVFVYYRRTLGSTYIVANSRFKNDKIKMYNYLIDNSNSIYEKLVLVNRKFLFELGNNFLNKCLNIGFYDFTIRSALNFSKIDMFKNNFKLDITKHNEHLKIITTNANHFIDGQEKII